MPAAPASSIRHALRTAVTAAARRRDRTALTVYRTALAAIDNAEAVPLPEGVAHAGAIEASALGVGAAEAERRVVSEGEMRGIVAAEAEDRREAAGQLDRHRAQPDRAAALREGAALLDALLAGRGAADADDVRPGSG